MLISLSHALSPCQFVENQADQRMAYSSVAYRTKVPFPTQCLGLVSVGTIVQSQLCSHLAQSTQAACRVRRVVEKWCHKPTELGRWRLWQSGRLHTWQCDWASCAKRAVLFSQFKITRQSVKDFAGPFASHAFRKVQKVNPQATQQVPNLPSRAGRPSLAVKNSFA